MSGAGRQDFTDKAGAALKVIIPISLAHSVRHLTASLRFFSPIPRSPPPSTSVICSRERPTRLPRLFNPMYVSLSFSRTSILTHTPTLQSEKSATQRVGDSLSGNQNENAPSLVDKAKNAVGLGGNSTTHNNNV